MQAKRKDSEKADNGNDLNIQLAQNVAQIMPDNENENSSNDSTNDDNADEVVLDPRAPSAIKSAIEQAYYPFFNSTNGRA